MVLQLYYLHFSWKNCREKNWHSFKAGTMDNADVGSAFVAAQKRRFSVSEIALKDAAAPILCVDQDYRPEPKTKQRKKGDDLQEQHHLLSFCDEILYEIFKYLDTPSIMALMHCSPRLENLLLDHRFWHGIDLSNGPLPLGILEEILGRATEKTHTIKICGPPSSQHVAGEFRQFTCTLTTVFPKVATQLQVLELQGVSLDFEYIRITQFPGSLKRLKLKDCSVKVGDQGKSIFHTIEMQLVNLEDLSIEDNNWFEPYYIMALSKLPKLKRLSLKGCQMLCKFVPYGSMAARFGFMKLEVLDLRLTPINNSDLQCFSAIENLKELLLESPLNPPPEAASPEKVNNGNDEAATSQSESLQVLNDDEPSTSRAAMEHLRACKLRRGHDHNESDLSDRPRPCHDIFHSDPIDDSPDEPAPASSASCSRKGVCLSSESEDEDTSSASASSSDKSDSAAPRSNGHSGRIDPNASSRSPLVVIALPSVGAVRQGMPPAADQADNEAGPDEAGPGAGQAPRAYVYVPGGQGGGENPQANMQSILEQMADHLRAWRGNNPAHSRFLPRRDQVIYMNPQAMAIREPMLVMHSARRRSLARGNFDQVVHHPLFWNMLDPLDRDYARRLRHRQMANPCPPPQYYVSDRAIYSFGRAARPVQPDVVWIRNINRSPDNRLERISLRNYQHITNHTLEHLVQCSPFLVFIDVSGTSVTVLGLRKFKEQKPECETVATHLDTDEQPPNDAPKDDGAPDDEEQPSPSPPQPAPPAAPQEFDGDVA